MPAFLSRRGSQGTVWKLVDWLMIILQRERMRLLRKGKRRKPLIDANPSDVVSAGSLVIWHETADSPNRSWSERRTRGRLPGGPRGTSRTLNVSIVTRRVIMPLTVLVMLCSAGRSCQGRWGSRQGPVLS